MAKLFFIYARHAGVLSFGLRDSRGIMIDNHGSARVPAPSHE
jgi:hypothetical protein